MPEIDQDQLAALRQSDPDGQLESAIRTAYGYPNGFEDLTHGQARFLSIKSNADEVLKVLNQLTPVIFLQKEIIIIFRKPGLARY